MKDGRMLLLVSLWVALCGCSTQLDINAPAEEIWAVWGVLNPADSVQYIRISKGFLSEGNALEFAREHDLSGKNLMVELSDGSRKWTATETDSVLKDPVEGTFYPYITLYRLDTPGTNSLEAGKRYTLSVSQADDAAFFLQAETLVPESSDFNRPRHIRAANGFCLQALALDMGFEVKFQPSVGAAAYELRAFLDYERNGIRTQASFGPTALFEESVSCSGGGLICYQLKPKTLIDLFRFQMDPQPGEILDYEAKETQRCGPEQTLPDAFRFELTAIDSALFRYIEANSPKFTDFNSIRTEYTNIHGSARSLGVFGSLTISEISAAFDPCTEFLLGLRRESPRPDCGL